MIEVTQDAINQMNHILEKNGDAAVRYELKAGGCGGIIAEWGTEPHHEPEQGERTWPLANGLFVMDEFTKDFIDGGIVNYDLTNFMPNFIVSVPGKGQCGCGSSFVIGGLIGKRRLREMRVRVVKDRVNLVLTIVIERSTN